MIQTIRVRTNSEDTARVYRLEGVSEKQAKILAEKLFCEDINQTYTINKPILHLEGASLDFARDKKAHLRGVTTEIAYKPGVMNPEVASIIKSAKDLGIKLTACDSSQEYFKKAPVYNPLIEYIVKKPPTTLLVKGKAGETKTIAISKMNYGELLSLSKDKLFLNLEEMKTIQKYFQKIKRDPTDCELETLAQTWSEHSGHKTFKANLVIDGKKKESLIERIKKEALKHKKNIVSAFVDNSGVMDFYDGWAISGKGETHNAPSSIEPYGGAMTGSGGVFRDIAGTGQGAKNVISQDVFCFAPPDYPNAKLPPGTLPPRYLLERVVAGVRDYGNRMGIPTNNGSIHFHNDFRARPTVFVGAYGIMPKKYAKKGVPKLGDLIVVVGGRTGRDGIHGATFSSGEMTEKTIAVNAQAVQIGNAIEEKRMFDALLEARDQNLIRAMQDVGGGGFSSAIGEIGEELGVIVNLEKAPLKYQGLAPWEIWMSESQERMIVVLPKKDLKKFAKICQKYNTEATVLGKFDGPPDGEAGSKKLKVFYGKEQICDLDMKFLHHGLPERVLKAIHPRGVKATSGVTEGLPRGEPRSEKEWVAFLEKVLASGDVCSKEPIVRMYDHTVQGTSVLPPFTGVKMDGPNDAVVIRPLLNKPYGMIVSHGLNPALNNLDPYWGSIWAATEAISNYVAVGGDYENASLINNYVWPFPDGESLWSLDRSVDAVVDFMKTLKIPVISGKDSLSSTYRGSDGTIIKIPPVLCMSVFGKIPDVTKTVSSDFKKVSSTIVLVGKQDLINEVPRVDLKSLPKMLDKIYKAIQTGKVLACHDVSEGGLITTVFEMCLGGGMGASIHLGGVTSSHLRGDRMGSSEVEFLFNETSGCFVVEVENEKVAKKLFNNIPYQILGKTQTENNIKVDKLFNVSVAQLAKAWKKPMEEIFS